MKSKVLNLDKIYVFIKYSLTVTTYLIGVAFMGLAALGGLFYRAYEPATFDLILGYIMFSISKPYMEKFNQSERTS